MITQFRIENFRAHRDTTLDLGQFTLLVGENASGKTSVLDALCLRYATATNPGAVLVGKYAPRDICRRGEHRIRLSVSSTPAESVLNIDVQDNEDWHIYADDSPRSRYLGDGRKARLYALSADRIAEISYSNRKNIEIGRDGTDTAFALAAIKLDNDAAFGLIQDAMRTLVPAVLAIRLRREEIRGAEEFGIGDKIYFDFRGAPGVPAHGASHGTLILLSLLTVLYSPDRPSLILLDDLDHALHPKAQMDVVRLLKGLLELPQFADLQIVATTHSPYVLDGTDPSNIYAFALDGDGIAVSKPLSQHPSAAKMTGMLSSGQLWSLDDERDWVLKE